jgi:acyl-CoA synthetase (AMP-forming)/AMP-acid ligase II
MDVSAPRTRTARAVADAVAASAAHMVFLSPAAVLNVAATAEDLDDAEHAALAGVRTFLSTGAPVSETLLTSVARLVPNAGAHTPYGMTECLLVTDIDLAGLRAAATADEAGVCVGRPIGSNRVLISPLDDDGAATGEPTTSPGVLGEIVISAPHVKERYDRLWLTDVASRRGTEGLAPPKARWHRTGDVGHLDAEGRLWVEGRLPHVLRTAQGLVAPVGPEQQIERVCGVRRAAVVGVGPAGTQQAVAVVETRPDARRARLAPADLAEAIRASTALPLAAVLVVPRLPTDIRHNSKIERVRLAEWADRILAGGRLGSP